MADDPKGSFVRWQSTTIGQLTYAINLVLGFAVAALGFQVALLHSERFALTGWRSCVFGLSLLSLAGSIALGLLVVVNRLRSFRATAAAARAREDKRAESEIEGHRQTYRRLDRRTWPLFWWQIGTFGAGVGFAVVSLLATVSNKLS